MRSARSLLIALPPVAAGIVIWSAGDIAVARHRTPRFGDSLDRISMEQRKQFRDGKDEFEAVEEPDEGLGPIFNGTSCGGCHSVPSVGGSSPVNETRAQRVEGGVNLEFPGGSLFQSEATFPSCAETIPSSANVIAERQTTPLFGSGLIEAIPDRSIVHQAARQARKHPEQAGRVHWVEDLASGKFRVGRFGWKSQHATLLAFSADAYVNEMGITNPLFPAENAPNGDQAKLSSCDAVPDPEDEDDFEAFADFMRLLAPPPRGSDSLARRFKGRGEPRGRHLFNQVGCAVCHTSNYQARSRIRAINGRQVEAFSDFLLHDVGTGDGIVQGDAQANELRTAPLWGIKESAPYLHDGTAATLEDAILRHANQGAAARDAYSRLSVFERKALLDFLDSI